MKFRPLHDRVVVKRVEEEQKTKGGIIIPDTAKEKPMQGEVLAVGPGARNEDGELIPMGVTVGDRVLFGKWSGTEVKLDGDELLIMKEVGHHGRARGERRPGEGRLSRPRASATSGDSTDGCQGSQVLDRRPDQDAQGRRRSSTDAVKVTLGPKGRNVVLDKSFGAPRITKDGVTVAKEIELSDKFENMGAQMVREVASKTSDVAGDGTTTATILAAAIVREGGKAVAAGMNPMDLKRGVDLAVEAVVKDLAGPGQEGHHLGGDRPGRHDLVQRRRRDRQDAGRGDAEGRQRGRDHGRGGQEPGHRARRGRGHAVRPRLHLALLRHQRREDAGRARGRPTS